MANQLQISREETSLPSALVDRRAVLSLLMTLPFAASAVGAVLSDALDPDAAAVRAGRRTDVSARYVAQLMSATLGQTVVIENRSGGGGAIATTAAARAEPDGYTLLVVEFGDPLNSAGHVRKARLRPDQELCADLRHVERAHLLVANAEVPVKNAKELAEYAKANVGKFNFAAATGTPPHILAYVFKELTGRISPSRCTGAADRRWPTCSPIRFKRSSSRRRSSCRSPTTSASASWAPPPSSD